MKLSLGVLKAKIAAFFCKEPLDSELDEELAIHLEMAEADLLARGASPTEARRRARIELGGLGSVREQHRDARGFPMLETLAQDLRHTYRTLRRDRGFSLITVAILGLGIGANTAVFSIVQAILLQPLPFVAPDRLAWITNEPLESLATDGLSAVASRADVFEEWERRSRSFEDLTAYNAFFTFGSTKLLQKGEPTRLRGVAVAQDFFSLLGIPSHIGRTFSTQESLPNGPPVVLLSHDLWQRRFDSDPAILGTALNLDDTPVTVVGVLPASFDFGSVFAPGSQVDLFYPMVIDVVRSWGNTLAVIGRLREGTTIAEANLELKAITQQIKVDRPELGKWFESNVVSLTDRVNGESRRPLWMLLASVGVVLLIACANIASLQLARAASRRKEFAVRAALGAGRARLLRQLVTEGLVLSSLGALVGLILTVLALFGLQHLPLVSLPLLLRAKIDLVVLAFMIAATAVSGLLFGLAPAAQISLIALQESLRDSDRGSSGSNWQARVRSVLVIGEIALACMLLVGAGLLVRSFLRVLDIDLGFRPEQALVLNIDPGRSFDDPQSKLAYFNHLLNGVEAIPGVDKAAITDALPLDRNRSWGVNTKEHPLDPDVAPAALVSRVGAGYLRAMGIPLLAGRDISTRDTGDHELAVVINETMAHRLWPDQDPLGTIAMIGGQERRVVGVAKDIRHSSLETASELEAYLSHIEDGGSTVDLVIRTLRPREMMALAIRSALKDLDPTLPVSDLRPLSWLVDRAVFPRRFFMSLLTAFAAFALVLASLGIYGVISYSAGQRTQEVAIRMALGASAGQVKRQVLRDTFRLAISGIVAGTVGAIGVSRMMDSLLYRTPSTDPTSFVIMLAAILVVALIAGYIPARRASKTSPLTALRSG